MMRPFERDMERITIELLRLSALAEERIGQAIRSLCDRRPELAVGVIRGDAVIDELEVRIEQDCLNFLARHDPLASDLRRIAAILKINHELERMADEAVSIARRALALGELPIGIPIPEDLEAMSRLVEAMVRGSLDAFIDADAGRARAIIARDDRVDRLHRRVIELLEDTIREHPDTVSVGLNLFSSSCHLERVADHATNICEEVIYLSEGAIVRHRHEDADGVRVRVGPGRVLAADGSALRRLRV